MNIGISTRLAMGFGILLALIMLMAGLGIYSVATLEWHLTTVVRSHFKDTMDTVDIRETVNEVTRALYALPQVAPELRATEIARVEGSEKIVRTNFDTLRASLTTSEGANLLKKAEATYASFASARLEVLGLLSKQLEREAGEAMQMKLRPSHAAFANTLDAIVTYQTDRVEEAAEAAGKVAKFTRILLLGIGLFAVAIGVGCSWWIARSIARPTLAAANLATAISEGDMTRPVRSTSKDELGRLLASLEKMRLSITHEVRTIRGSAENVALAAKEIALGSSDLSSRAEAQAAHLEETAASMEQLTSTVQQNADSATHAQEVAASASKVAARGGHAVRSVVGTMTAISGSSQRISDIIGVIDSIAFQTNILALNAAVEAARAGEQGRGFAVVASEVRALAQRSAQAAKEISNLIQESTRQVEAGAELVDKAGRTVDEIVSATESVSGIVAEIAKASQEQLIGIAQVNEAVSQMSGATQQNASVVTQSAAAAAGLATQAHELTATVARFKLDSVEHVPDSSDRAGAPQSRRSGRRTTAPLPQAMARTQKTLTPSVIKPRRDESEWKEF